MRVRSRLIPAMSGCDWKTDVLDLAGKSWDDACPTVTRFSAERFLTPSSWALSAVSVHETVHVMVGVGKFELPTPCSRSRCATRLRYTPSGWSDVYRQAPPPRNQGLPRGRMSGRPGTPQARAISWAGLRSGEDASGDGPPRLAAREDARLEPAPCAEPISEDGFHWGVAKR